MGILKYPISEFSLLFLDIGKSKYVNYRKSSSLLQIRGQIAAVHWKILSYISYIGCGLSAFFTALSVLMYAFSRYVS